MDLSREDLATKSDLDLVELKLESKIDKLANTIYIMGGAIFTVCCIPILQKFF